MNYSIQSKLQLSRGRSEVKIHETCCLLLQLPLATNCLSNSGTCFALDYLNESVFGDFVELLC
jgi:hypothetical protein